MKFLEPPVYNKRVKDLDELLVLHKAFWKRELVERPILRVFTEERWKPYEAYVGKDGNPLEGHYEIKRGLLNHLETLRPYLPRGSVLYQDLLNGAGPYDICYTELILGCRIFRVGPSVSPSSFIQDWQDLDTVVWNGSNPWFEEIDEIIKVLAKELKDTYPVTQPLFRGPFDMAEAAMPTEMLFTGFYEEPKRIRSFLHLCCDIFIDTAKYWYEHCPPFHGGYVIRDMSGLWAPGKPVMFQQDAMKNISPEMYRDFIRELDIRICQEFEFPIIHTHSGSSHILPIVADEENLEGVEVAIDPPPFAVSPTQLIPQFKLIQQKNKSLLIEGFLQEWELHEILQELSPVGLAVNVQIQADEQDSIEESEGK